MASQHLGKGALAAAIATHHRMDLAGPNREVHPLQDRLIVDSGLQVADLKQYWSVGADHSGEREEIAEMGGETERDCKEQEPEG
jgi:hypothetical protein